MQPRKFGVETVVISKDPAEEMTSLIDAAGDAVIASRGLSEALTVLIPKLVDSVLLTAFCKRLGARNDNWRIAAAPNPSDRLDRVYVSLRFALDANVDAEILGFGPFTFLPATRRAPITALEIRTKVEGHKKRGRSEATLSHLADIPWKGGGDSWYDRAWTQTQDARRAVLGGDDSAARARITFAIPRTLWDGHDT